jgi:hypothetical protein
MTAQSHSALNEPTLADAIVHIEQSEALRLEKRSHWTCSMRFVARALDRSPSLVPARWLAIRPRLAEIHSSQLGVTAKTLANHRANVRAALNLFCAEKNVPRRGTPLDEAWSRLWASIDDLPKRNLSRFFRYLSAQGISPEAVDDAVVQTFLGHWERTGLRGPDAQSRRQLVRAWNGCAILSPDGPLSDSSSQQSEPPRAAPTGKLSPPDCAAGLTLFWRQGHRGSFRYSNRV